MYEFHVSRKAREKYGFNQSLFRFDGNVIFADFLAARTFAQKINQHRDLINLPETVVRAGDLNALGIIDEIFHVVFSLYRRQVNVGILAEATDQLHASFGKRKLNNTLRHLVNEFPPAMVYQGELSVNDYLKGETENTPHQQIVLEELLMLWITNQNPATHPFNELFNDTQISQTTLYPQIIEYLEKFFKGKPSYGPDHQDLVTMLRSPAIESPHSLTGQLDFIRRKWSALLGNYLYRLLNAIDLINEEQKAIFIGTGTTQVPSYQYGEDEENFSPDSDWMPRTVIIAKNTYVWLHQLSKEYGRDIKHLDQIPDEELDKLAGWGFKGLWLIGLWERSEASKRIKQLCGNPDAVASAYSLRNYSIAEDLGGEEACNQLRDRARQRGIRLASDMVPNHMGIDSDWVLYHPDWFISLPYSPFPGYSFNGQNLSPDDRIEITIEDHYYDRTDAAVVFRRVDRQTDEERYIYHGNDGTSMPWNDTAQLNYLQEEVREAVIQTILHVARKFPIIRFDAAMTLARKHYQRLWFPEPGSGGAIPSRSAHGMKKDRFNEVFPKEFWRQVVDRVAEEVPETLLLAEAFWLMEGYFVRTLGMHRVYNSAFMNMLRNEENSKYRQLIKNTLEFDPEILKRYVNFMNNPDEATAVEQFGKGEKYFGICTLMATMPGLPMFGHGQIEGLAEKYGMEFYRPYWDEKADHALIQRHQQEIFPLLKRRDLFSEVDNFLIYDFMNGNGKINDNVFAYTNGVGHQRALVIYHNHFSSAQGYIHSSAKYRTKVTGVIEEKRILEGLCLNASPDRYVIFRDIQSGLEYLRSTEEVHNKGLYFELNAYEYHVYVDFQEVVDNESSHYEKLTGLLNGRGVPSIDHALKDLHLAPILDPLRELINPDDLKNLYQSRLMTPKAKLNQDLLSKHATDYSKLLDSISRFVNAKVKTENIVKEAQRGLEAILKLPVFEDRYPMPGSKRYLSMVAFIQQNLANYPFIWFVLILWNDLRLIGRVITSDIQYAEISRSWLDEWGLLRQVENTLINLGLDMDQAQSAIKILKLLTTHQNWTDTINGITARALMENWLVDDEIRNFLNINRYDDILWFSKEAFETLMWWIMAAGLIDQTARPQTSFSEALEVLFDAFEMIQTILKSETKSEYQAGKLLEGLK